MNRCSYFIEGKALFGCFPTQTDVNELEAHGVRHFIDLTGFRERRTTPYSTQYQYIKYPIIDHQTPRDWKSFAQLILEICKIVRQKNNDKLYVHCKGGHGRAGIVVACVLCYYHSYTPDHALHLTSRYHSQRKEMRLRWRQLGSPQHKRQKDFVRSFFKPYFYGRNRNSHFDNMSDHSVTIENMGKFPNAHFTFQAFRNPDDEEYVKELKKGNNVVCESQRDDWDDNKMKYMMIILEMKFRQHTSLMKTLLSTGLRPLVKYSPDSYWGNGSNKQGKNIHGKILSILRERFLYEDMLRAI